MADVLKQPVIIQVSKQLIVSKDIKTVTNTLDSFIPQLAERNRNRVRIEVLGYDDDPRELFDIPEIRKYFKDLFDAVDGAFYWIDPQSYMFIFWALMLVRPYREGGYVGLLPEDMQKYLKWGYTKLNAFCLDHGLSPDESTKAISNAVKAF